MLTYTGTVINVQTFAAKPGLVEANLQAFRRGVEVGRAVREQEVTS